MKIDLLSGACGAEINGINLKDTSSSNIEIIKNLKDNAKKIITRQI